MGLPLGTAQKQPPYLVEATRPDQLSSRIERLRTAQRSLHRRSTESVVASLDRVVETWLRPDSVWLRRAEALLPDATGFSAAMIRHALPLLIEPLRSPHLGKLLEEEIDNRLLRAERRDEIPKLVLHVLPGNLPGLAAIPVALSLSLRSAALVKSASGDRVFPQLWAQSIREVDEDLGSCVDTCYWTGGDRLCEKVAFSAADLVVASGDDESVADARRRCSTRFIGHGHRVSLAVVTREVVAEASLAEQAADGLGFDVAVWDQRGCLSPQVCFTEATFEEAHDFATRLANAFAKYVTLLPPRQLSVEEQVAVHRFRDAAEWEHIAGRRRERILPNHSLDWTIVVEADSAFRPTPLCRSLRILPLSNVHEITEALRPVRAFLQGAGLACIESRRDTIANLLADSGVSYVSDLGEMQKPPLAWRQGGRPRIADWIATR